MMILDLNGSWELKDEAGEKLCQVEVPGSVISGLYAAGKIAYPYYRENEYETRDLFWKDYEFTRSFEVSEELLAQKERRENRHEDRKDFLCYAIGGALLFFVCVWVGKNNKRQ